jgi:ABC-type antimicrobial peptide transport system permease subunit
VIEEPQPMYYLPVDHLPPVAKGWSASYIAINADPARIASVTASVRSLLRAEFPGGIPSIVRLSDYLEPQYRPWRLGATLFTVFGVLALVVAVVGIYSTTAYGVQQRLHEFGVRIALGAQVVDVVRHVIGEGLRVVVVGVASGIALALAAGRFVATLLYGVRPGDPAVELLVAIILVAVGVLAALLPAWRAARVDPASTLRAE